MGGDWYNTGLSGARYGRHLFSLGLPVTYDTYAGVGYLLSEEYAELLTDDVIEALLHRPVITSGNAIAALQKRRERIKEKLGVSAIAVTAYGANLFVVGYAPKETEITSDKRNMILRAADEISGGLPAYIAETSRLCLYPRPIVWGGRLQ